MDLVFEGSAVVVRAVGDAGLGLVATAGLFVAMILRGRQTQAATATVGDGEHRILPASAGRAPKAGATAI
ncbi:MAG: hypothetical protein ACKV2O_08335 [Acidimicrobiales bacterium]